jgi:hypothetical protein
MFITNTEWTQETITTIRQCTPFITGMLDAEDSELPDNDLIEPHLGKKLYEAGFIYWS